MKKRLFALALALCFCTGAALAVTPLAPESDKTLPVSYCETIRLAVVTVAGEQPLLMDTHYAMSYIRKAEELKLIGEANPMASWGFPVTKVQFDEIKKNIPADKQAAFQAGFDAIAVERIVVEGDMVIDTQGKEPFVQNGLVMLPLRAVAEAAGFTVTWVPEEPYHVSLDNGEVKTAIEIGSDSYYMASSQAIGLTQAKPLGAAPMLVDDLTYAPAVLFDLLCGKDTVSVKAGALSLTP